MLQDLLQIGLLLGMCACLAAAAAALNREVSSQLDFELRVELGHWSHQIGHNNEGLVAAFGGVEQLHQVVEYVYVGKLLPLREHFNKEKMSLFMIKRSRPYIWSCLGTSDCLSSSQTECMTIQSAPPCCPPRTYTFGTDPSQTITRICYFVEVLPHVSKICSNNEYIENGLELKI